MAQRIEDYALIGDLQTAALVGIDGSVDWLCFPRFDSDACFAALLGGPENGRWRLAPHGGRRATRRRYRGETLVLETEWRTRDGTVLVVDFMPLRGEAPDVVRVVEGVTGRVRMRSEVSLRFHYGKVPPRCREIPGGWVATVGPDSVTLRTPVPVEHRRGALRSEFEVAAGERVGMVLTWRESHLPPPRRVDAVQALAETTEFWDEWSDRCTHSGPYRDAVVRSLVTLKALTYAPTGGIIAAPTTSLPEALGGVRNWDYRYCWLRDSTYTLQSLLYSGYVEEAKAWREWLLRATTGRADQLQILYGPAGERRVAEWEVDWLPGYESSAPVRVGNAAVGQLQLDVYGEVVDALYLARTHGLRADHDVWAAQTELLHFLEGHWQDDDASLWEVRGDNRPFVHSKVLAWVAADRAVRTIEETGLPGPLARWRRLRADIHREVCERGYDAERNTFTQSYGSRELDSATLLIPQVGFLPPEDERVAGTVDAVQRELMHDGFLRRYDTADGADGLPGTEGAFLACSFWLADDLALIGRPDAARDLFERLLDIRNDVGLLSEEYDPATGRMVGNFPQAFSHVPLVNTAQCLAGAPRPRVTGRR